MFQLIDKEKTYVEIVFLKSVVIVTERFQDIWIFNLDYSLFRTFSENFQRVIC